MNTQIAAEDDEDDEDRVFMATVRNQHHWISQIVVLRQCQPSLCSRVAFDGDKKKSNTTKCGTTIAGSKRRKQTYETTIRMKMENYPKGTKLVQEFDEYHRPIGEHKPIFSTLQGIVIRDMSITPLHHESWHYVPKEDKNEMVNKILETFDIGQEPARRKFLLKALGKKWKEYRCELKKNHYSKHGTDEERLLDRPVDVSEYSWQWMVKHWSTEKVQTLSEKNKARRSTQKMHHRTGRKSFAVLADEDRRKTGVHPSRIKIFKLAYEKFGVFPKGIVQQKAHMIQRLCLERKQGRNTLTDEQIFVRVFGEDGAGRLRCMGHGPTFTSVFGRRNDGHELLRQIEWRRMTEDANRERAQWEEGMEEVLAGVNACLDEEMKRGRSNGGTSRNQKHSRIE